MKKTHGFLFIFCITMTIIFSNCNDRKKNYTASLNYGDAHTHLTTYGESSIDSLNKYGVTIVRDCGGDLSLLKKWRDEINSGKKKGPKIYFAGPIIDGRQELPFRISVKTQEQARHAVDSLALLGVDFIKTHASISPECYFAVLREAKKKKLNVVSHLPWNIPVWLAVDSGLRCVEHAAESFLSAPIGAGFVKASGDSAVSASIDWWRSLSGDSVINYFGKLKIYFTPTLYSYKVWALQGKTKEEIDSRLNVLKFLKELTLKLHKAGVIILAGSDLYDTTWQHETPGKTLFEEIKMLEESGLTKQEATNSATINLQEWIKHLKN